jgi:hypothetical protein
MKNISISTLFLSIGVVLCAVAMAAHGQVTRPPPEEDQLKNYLMGEFIAIDGYDVENTRRIKAGGVSDDLLRRVLTDIYSEAKATLEQTNDPYECMVNKLRRENAIRELGVCANDATKAFLLDLAADKSKNEISRTVAIGSYLRAANAQETRDALIRFMVGEERLDSQARSSILAHASEICRGTDQAKKQAIIETLYVALAQEDAKWLFRVYDNILCSHSRQYTNSAQRQAILQRLIRATPTCLGDENAMPGLEATRRELQKREMTANVNTNLDLLKARDFNKPVTEEELVDLAIPPLETSATDEAPQDKPLWRRKIGIYAIGGVTAFALIVAGVWPFLKRRIKRP